MRFGCVESIVLFTYCLSHSRTSTSLSLNFALTYMSRYPVLHIKSIATFHGAKTKKYLTKSNHKRSITSKQRLHNTESRLQGSDRRFQNNQRTLFSNFHEFIGIFNELDFLASKVDKKTIDTAL